MPNRAPRADKPSRPTVEIRVEDLHKAFNGHDVLRGVHLEARSGEMVAIVGGSGSGKTVLMEHIIGHLRPDRGRVQIADHSQPGATLRDLATLDEDQMDAIRRQWAIVFQHNALFSGTVFDNIALWLRENRDLTDDKIMPIARRVLDAVGFDEDVDEVLRKQRDELSGGMAKRVAVARALAMEPRMIFYDEPTAGLDPAHAAQIYDLIAMTHAATGSDGDPRTTLIITHDKDLLRRLRPRVVMLHDGGVFFDGDFDAFEVDDSPIIRPYFDVMSAINLTERPHPVRTQ